METTYLKFCFLRNYKNLLSAVRKQTLKRVMLLEVEQPVTAIVTNRRGTGKSQPTDNETTCIRSNMTRLD